MPLLGGKGNKFKAQPPKIRIERVAIERPTPPKPKSKPSSILAARATSTASSSRAASTPGSSPAPRHKSNSPYPSSTDERKVERKRKAAPSTPRTKKSSPTTNRITFDKDSDNEDDGWMNLDTRKRQRKSGDEESLTNSSRKLRNVHAYDEPETRLKFIHAPDIPSHDTKSIPMMGGTLDDVAIEIQYPSPQPKERYELVWGKDKIDAVDASIRIVKLVAENYLTNDEAEPFINQTNGFVRRLEKASNRNIQDLAGFKAAIAEYNQTILGLVDDGIVAKNLDNMHELPAHLVAFILNQVYDRTVAPKVDLLSKYENGTDYVYGELLHPFVTKLFIEQTKMTSDQVFVDLGSGVGNVVLQAALEVGCEAVGCEMMENACNLADAQAKEFDARCKLWGIQPGKVKAERGDFRKNPVILEALQRADVVLVNNKAFTSQLNDDLVRMFLDLKPGCKIISLRSFVTDFKSTHNVNDVGSTILDVEEFAYPEGYVSWTNAGGPYYISTRKGV